MLLYRYRFKFLIITCVSEVIFVWRSIVIIVLTIQDGPAEEIWTGGIHLLHELHQQEGFRARLQPQVQYLTTYLPFAVFLGQNFTLATRVSTVYRSTKSRRILLSFLTRSVEQFCEIRCRVRLRRSSGFRALVYCNAGPGSIPARPLALGVAGDYYYTGTEVMQHAKTWSRRKWRLWALKSFCLLFYYRYCIAVSFKSLTK
jgi:hypothetical protein